MYCSYNNDNNDNDCNEYMMFGHWLTFLPMISDEFHFIAVPDTHSISERNIYTVIGTYISHYQVL